MACAGDGCGPDVTEIDTVVLPAGTLPIAVRAPVRPSIVYAVMLLEPKFVTYASWPDGFTPTPKAPVPAVNGDPATGLSAPVVPSTVLRLLSRIDSRDSVGLYTGHIARSPISSQQAAILHSLPGFCRAHGLTGHVR